MSKIQIKNLNEDFIEWSIIFYINQKKIIRDLIKFFQKVISRFWIKSNIQICLH